MAQEFKLMMDELRKGASVEDAFELYCQARLVEPIHTADYYMLGADHPGNYRPALTALRDGLASGLEDNAIEANFEAALKSNGVGWREMHQREKWTKRDLYNRMSDIEKKTALDVLGVQAIAAALTH
jgi:hypothetical protein